MGIANTHSIAFGAAQKFIEAGAEIAVTYADSVSEPFVRKAVQPWLEAQTAPIFLPCDVRKQDQMEALFEAIRKKWGRLDFLLHSIAFAPRADLHGRVIDSSATGFAEAMDISCHSFIRVAKLAEPLMQAGGSMLTISYYGGEKVVPNYNLMGPVKAALEAVVRELASELGPSNIRVNALSPGPIETRAASGLVDFAGVMQDAVQKSPEHRLVDIAEVGAFAAFLVSDFAKALTGTIHPIDAGYHIMA